MLSRSDSANIESLLGQALGRSQPPRRLSWPAVTGLLVVCVALLVALTIYLPARVIAQQPAVVCVQGLDVTLMARPRSGSPHVLDVDVRIAGPLSGDTAVGLTASMPAVVPTMATGIKQYPNMPGHYMATFELGMGGTWQVQVNIRRPGSQDAIARFDVRT